MFAMTKPAGKKTKLSGAFLRVLAVSGAVALAGCAQGLDGLIDAQERDSFLLTGSVTDTTPTTALGSLPREAGRVLSVREQRVDGGLNQHIVLSGDALASSENWLKVSVRDSRLVEAPSQNQLYNEMVAAFGGRSLPLYNYIITNDHGPVGLAYGPVSGHGNCAYIWQEARQSDVQATERLPFAHDAGAWSARARLCRERLTQDHAIAFAQGLSLGAFSDPLYAPLASAGPAQAPVINARSLASLDDPTPASTAAPRRLTPRTTARAPTPAPRPQTAVSAATPDALTDALTVPVPVPAASTSATRAPASTPQPRQPLPAETAPTRQAHLAIPLPQ